MEFKSKLEKYLTFSLGTENYGIPILKVKEIIGLMDITPVPKSPEFIRGVINLRGNIIPIMDLRLKFKMGEKEYNERTCIIVVEVLIETVRRLIGIVVDMVSEVVTINSDDIEPPPEYGTKNPKNFLIGMGKIKGKVIILLNIGQIITFEEIVVLLNDTKENEVVL